MHRRHDLEKKILSFLYKWLRPIRIGDIRKELEKDGWSAPHSTLNSIIKRFVADNFVKWEKYGPVVLTEKGKKVAAHQQRHFHLLVSFLLDSFAITLEEAQKESIALAGVISCNLIELINAKLNNPEKCKCNEVIPKVNACHKKEGLEVK
jgi:DtxR family Mn-dependent transcriptional regulator